MARPLRIEYPGAFYHVTSRGNERKRLFAARLMIKKAGIRTEDRKMTSKSKSWSFIFILISGAILLFPFFVYAQTPIDCGQTLAGSISTAGQKNSYTFSASANDVVTIRTRKTSGNFTVYLDLYSPGDSGLQRSD